MRVKNKSRLLAAAAILAIATPAAAQWLTYPTAGVPRNPDGSPNLSAPAPRTAGGQPDFSGTWEPEKNRPCPPEGCDDVQVTQEFAYIGWSLKGGLPFQPWAAQLRKTRTENLRLDDPATHCLPIGLVALHTTPFLKKVVQTPGLLVILNERNVTYRQIFTDGRPLPLDPQPSWVGYSTGRWDGDTLVVESNGFRDDGWLDRSGSPLTSAAKITERFRRVSFGRLEIEITVDDPKAYTAPWTVKVTQVIALNTDFLDYVCLENEKDIKHLVGK